MMFAYDAAGGMRMPRWRVDDVGRGSGWLVGSLQRRLRVECVIGAVAVAVGGRFTRAPPSLSSCRVVARCRDYVSQLAVNCARRIDVSRREHDHISPNIPRTEWLAI